MSGRPCTICSHRSRAAIDSRLATNEPFQAVGTAFNVSVSALKRHKQAGHVAEAQQSHAQARSTAERVREHDARLAELTFGGDLRQQAEALRDHGISLMRRAESRGDDRSAIAAGAMVQRALDTLAGMDSATADDADTGCPSVMEYPPDLRPDQLDMLARQLPGVTVWLPSNGRGDGPGSRDLQADADTADAVI